MIIDRFNSFENTQYSIRAIYWLLNLPRGERYNTLLVGLIPNPTEPKRIENPSLDPFVNELLQLWKGVTLTSGDVNSFTLRAAHLSYISDVPATRKVCGFQGFLAKLVCSKCFKVSL